MTYDVVVIGLGTHGSAITAHCARSGLRVCGIDIADPPHAAGSHHGESRMIRKAYFEHPSYVPLVERAYAHWDALQRTSGEELIRRTGGLMIGPGDGELVPGAIHSARQFGLVHECLTKDALSRRFPQFRVDSGMEAVYEPEAGLLRPEACVRAHLRIAREAGAALLVNRKTHLRAHSSQGVELEAVDPAGGVETIRSKHCIVATGSGLADMGLSLSSQVVIERQTVAHFPVISGSPSSDPTPVFAIEEVDRSLFYGFPDVGSGIKVAQHHGGTTSPTNIVDSTVHPQDVENLRNFLRRRLPALDGPPSTASVCRYTNTVDGHFVIDETEPGLTVVSACSGHGFKFAPVIGEIMADRMHRRQFDLDISLFLRV